MPILIEDTVRNHLTRPEGDAVASMRAATPPGMAHWAGTGPADRTCRECLFWGRGKRFRRDKETEALVDRRCEKFRKLTIGAVAPGLLPFTTMSCKYFKPNDHAPPIIKPPRKKKGEA